MDKEKRIELYKTAINKWGELPQVTMVYEETGELISALAKYQRGRVIDDDVITELADVSIMVEQIATMLGYEKYEAEKQRKLERLEERLNK